MKIAIDVSPLESGHKVRGVGFYLQHLKDALIKYFPEHNYNFFTKEEELHGKIDIVHYPYFDPFFLTLPLFKKYPTVVTIHDLTPLIFPEHFPAGFKGKLRWQMQKLNARKADMIIADSNASKEDIVKIIDIQEPKVAVAYLAGAKEFKKLPITKTDGDALRKKYALPQKFALYVGDVTWNKNLPNLIKASVKANVPLIMVGKNLVQTEYDKNNPWNKDLVEVQKLCAQYPSVHRLGFVPTEDLVKLYNIASVFSMPSHYEGFGLPVIEAMQSGCPVITTKGGSLPEVAGDAALYVDGTNVESIANGLIKVYRDESLQKELSKKGIEQAKHFSWKETASQTIEAYEKAGK